MELERIIVSMMAAVIGLFYLLIPKTLVRMRVWWTKNTIGADFIPSAKTYLMYRILGIIFLIGALIVYFKN